MQMLKKIFNRDSKYYLELDEIEESKPVQSVVQTAQKAQNVVQEKATDVLESEPLEKAAQTAGKAKDVVQEKIQNVVPDQLQDIIPDQLQSKTTEAKPEPETKSPEKKPQATSSKKVSQKSNEGAPKSKKQPQAKEKSASQNSGASSYEPPFWVAAMYNNNSSGANSNGSQAEQTFATDNLMPIVTKYRRRPGPSLNKFKNMAKGTKTSRG